MKSLTSHQIQWLIAVLIIVAISVVATISVLNRGDSDVAGTTDEQPETSQSCPAVDQSLPVISESELSQYNGETKTAIYIGFNCLVYDVSEGAESFYGPGQGYHYLTGRDSTAQLEIFGGDTIAEKYPVVGRLE